MERRLGRRTSAPIKSERAKSPDATVDQQRGLVFPVRVKLTRRTLTVDGKPAALSPGMSATVEVVTGKRRVIDYLWSPVAKAVREAGRER